jgi:hypothetical protein
MLGNGVSGGAASTLVRAAAQEQKAPSTPPCARGSRNGRKQCGKKRALAASQEEGAV